MLDPVLEWISRLFGKFKNWLAVLGRASMAPFRAINALYRKSGWIIRGAICVALLPVVFGYGHFIWHSLWIRDYNLDYTDKLRITNLAGASDEPVAVQGGQGGTKTCGRSNIVTVIADLIDLNVNRNNWMSSHPMYKAGIFWALTWDQTWFFDNKAAFQRGVHHAASRTAIELADSLGRTRGTSEIDKDLQVAKGNIQFDQFTWYFNVSGRQPFGPTTRTPSYYRSARKSLQRYNERLANCSATYDARADNLLQFFDRIANDIGSASATIKDRSEQYNSGWFDTRADDIFWFSQGQLYAYYGILRATRADFADVVKSRGLDDIWDRMDKQLRSAAELDPLVVSNGNEDGLLMPTHLTTLGFYILRVRANLVEIRSILDR